MEHADQLLSYYGFGHCTVKWWRRAFFFLLNSYILYTLENPDKRRRLTHEQFHVTLATDLLHAAPVTKSVQYGLRSSHSSLLLDSLNSIFQCLGKSPAGWLVQHDCAVCSTKEKEDNKYRDCDLPMCIVPCFELYHTKRNPQKYLEPVC